MDRLLGHVDGFRGDVLHGWLVNKDQLDILQRFVVRDDQGHDLVLSTHVHRPDVCRALNIRGIFGFAIKRTWLDRKSASVTVMTPAGAVLPGGDDIPLPAPADAAPLGNAVNIFIHLAKAAGTSVRQGLTQHLSWGEWLLAYPGEAFSVPEHLVGTIPPYQQQHLRLIIGHFYFGVHTRLTTPFHYSTFVREPGARLRSNFNHHGVAQSIFPGQRKPDVVTAINQGVIEDFDNLMVRAIAGLSIDTTPLGGVTDDHVGLALANIRQHFMFIGLNETIEESFADLCDLMGFPKQPLPRENVTPTAWPDAKEHATAVDWPHVMHRNRFDTALYTAILEQGLVGRLK